MQDTLETITEKISGLRKYGRRIETPIRKGYIIQWSNSAATWYIHYYPIKVKEPLSLDADMIIAYGNKNEIKPLLEGLPPHPLFYNSTEFGLHNFSHFDKAALERIYWTLQKMKPIIKNGGYSNWHRYNKRSSQEYICLLGVEADTYITGFYTSELKNKPGYYYEIIIYKLPCNYNTKNFEISVYLNDLGRDNRKLIDQLTIEKESQTIQKVIEIAKEIGSKNKW